MFHQLCVICGCSYKHALINTNVKNKFNLLCFN